MSVVWLDGSLVPREAASVSVDDLGFLYGAACFETMRAAAGTVFRLERHLDRLEAGLEALAVPSPPRATLREAVAATLDANASADGEDGEDGASFAVRVRLTVSAGRGSGRPDLTAPSSPTVLVVSEPLLAPAGPARLAVASQRLDERRPLREAKTANYLLSLLALAEARTAGCDEALLLNHRSHVAEAATANLFASVQGVLVTPPPEDGPLLGVTREAVLECANASAIPVAERTLTLADLASVDELFLTNSIVGVRAVSAVAGRWRAGECPGPLTSALAAAYDRLVRSECDA